MGLAVKNLEIMIRFVYLVVVVVDLASRSRFRSFFLGCISVIWHSRIQVMEFALPFFFSSFFFFLNSVCVVAVVFPVRKFVAWKVD